MKNIQKDERLSGGIYLCQVGDTLSCGACCGLYNIPHASRRHLKRLLADRTDAFSALPRDLDAILSFGADIENRTAEGRPFPDFHHCPFVGLIGPDKSRVGCLLHPQHPDNQGIDYRGLSDYGGLACAVYFCPASRTLPPVVKSLVQQSTDDWYLYGLVIPEARFLTGLFDRVEAGLGRPLTEKDLIHRSRYGTVVREVLSLKCRWPHRPADWPDRCTYFFNDGRYAKPPVRYAGGRTGSRFHDLFHELVSRFDAPESLNAAEAALQTRIDRLIAAFGP